MMQQKAVAKATGAVDSGAVGILIDEFAADIRRRARAVECLLKPQRPPWDFDPDALPTDNARQLVAIKQEVEKTFNQIFSDRPRSRLSPKPGRITVSPSVA
ncbi:hypothetical protein ACFLQW_03290 [Candidatus Zixiibacteriota bacterium]